MKRAAIIIICCIGVSIGLFVYIKTNTSSQHLCPERAESYGEILNFFEEHKHWGNFIIRYDGTVSITSNKIPLSYINKIANVHFKKLEKLLTKTSTISVFKKHNMIFFELEPEYFLGVFFIRKPGYVYSSTGDDPRMTYDYMLNISRPFYPIGDNWYYTNNLQLG